MVAKRDNTKPAAVASLAARRGRGGGSGSPVEGAGGEEADGRVVEGVDVLAPGVGLPAAVALDDGGLYASEQHCRGTAATEGVACVARGVRVGTDGPEEEAETPDELLGGSGDTE